MTQSPGIAATDRAPESHAAAPSPPASMRGRTLLTAAVTGYALAVVALCGWMYLRGDVGRVATLLLFGPRWVIGVPLPPLALAALLWRRRLLWILAVTAVVLMFPFMGLRANLPAAADAPASLRVMSYNVNRGALDIAAFARLVKDSSPDVVVLQEADWRADYQWPEHWHSYVQDEFIIASPWPVARKEYLPHPLELHTKVVVRFEIQTPARKVQLFDIHLKSPRKGFEALLAKKAEGGERLQSVLEEREIESSATSRWIARFDGPKLVVGDFNMPVESVIYRRDWNGLENAFGETGWGFGFTKITELGGMSYGTRIDHVLYDEGWQCVRCWVGQDLGSDHLPVFAEFR